MNMYIKNRAAALVFRVALLLGCAYGMTAMSGLLGGGFSGRMLAYYTNLSNIICFGYMFAAAVHTAAGLLRKRPSGFPAPLPRLKKAFTLMIMITVLVYHFVLGPVMYRMNLNYEVYGLTDILVHYFTPLMFVLDWVLFDRKDTTRWYEPLLWLLIPLAYLAFVMIRAEVAAPLNAAGTRYPYFFLDLDLIGARGVAGYSALCLAAFTLLGYLFLLADRIPTVMRAARREEPRSAGLN